MNLSKSIFNITFLLLFSGPFVYTQEIPSDSLQKQILNHIGYHPKIDTLIEQLDKKDESNMDFLLNNIALMIEIYHPDTYGEYEMPILAYFQRHPEQLKLEAVTKAINSEDKELEILLYALDSKFENLITYLKYIDELLCQDSMNEKVNKTIVDKRQQLVYQQRRLIPNLNENDKLYMVFELKPGVDLKALICFIKGSFPGFYESANNIVLREKEGLKPLICVPYNKLLEIDEMPYKAYISTMYAINDCGLQRLLNNYRSNY